MDTEKAAALFAELWEYLKSLNDRSLQIQTNNARAAVRYLAAAESAEEQEEIIRTYFRILFPSRGGLSDVVLWDNDFQTRIALNEPLHRIQKELRKIMESSSDAPVKTVPTNEDFIRKTASSG